MNIAWPAWLFFIPPVVGLQIGFFVLIADRRAPLNRLVFLTSLAVSFWNLENIWALAPLPPSAMLWFRLGGIFLPLLSLHVLVVWTGAQERLTNILLAAGYGWAALISLAGPPLFLMNEGKEVGLQLPPYAFSPAFLAYTIYLVASLLLSTRILTRQFRRAGGQERTKVTLIAVSSGAAVLSAALGLVYHRGYFAHFLNAVTTMIYLSGLAWAVVRYRFGNPSLSLRTSAVHSVGLAIMTGLYVWAVVLIARWLKSNEQWDPLVVSFFCVLIAGPLFRPLQESMEGFLRRFFPLPRDVYYEGLKRFLPGINVLWPQRELAGFIVSHLATLFELQAVCLYVQPAQGAPFLQVATLEGDGAPVFRSLEGEPRSERPGPPIYDLRRLTQLPLVSIFPLAGRTRPFGHLATGRHPDGSSLTSEEREVLETLAYQAGIALENAELYAQLMAVKNHYLTVVQSSVNVILIVDSAGVVVDVNRTAERVLGPAETLLGRTVAECTGQPAVAAVVREVLATRKPVAGREVSLVKPGEEPRPYALNVSPFREADDALGESGALVAMYDLTPLRSMERQVERAERLAALGQLTAGLAHEIRNGLNKVAGYATILADELPPQSPLARFPRGILEDTAALEHLLGRFLSFAREEKLTRTTVALLPLLDRVLEALRPELKARNIHLVTDFAPATPPTFGDPAQLTQAVTNVVFNAVEAMEGGGTLAVSVRAAGDSILVSVKDTGPGIPEDQRELVFNPFFTTKAAGTGLGLSITHRIITRHGGAVHLDSRAGEGTTVVLQLPQAADVDEATTVATTPTSA
ncbi:MAG: ATP-binding protein [Chitinophagales bacterium]